MQTFLPDRDFRVSAGILDDRRCQKQVLEAWQVLQVLQGRTKGWEHHPAVLEWKGFERALVRYYNAFFDESIGRGVQWVKMSRLTGVVGRVVMPWWLGMEEFHASHRSNLLRKDPGYYGRFGWAEPADLPYVWPCQRQGEHSEEA